jgi:hypothetical protein
MTHVTKIINFDCSDEYVDGNGIDRPMTKEEYKKTAKELAQALRNNFDPPPRTMHKEEPSEFKTHAEILAAFPGSTLLRGWRMMVVPVDLGERPEKAAVVWKAIFHVVVAHLPKTEGAKARYEIPSNWHAPEEYIFLPSSRAHAELTDVDVLSGHWHFGVVLGGSRVISDVVEADNSARGKEKSMICSTPERCIAQRRQVFGFFPCFKEWYQQKPRTFTQEALAELFGFPCVDLGKRLENIETNYFDERHMRDAIENNTTYLVDGGRTSVHLQSRLLKELYEGNTSIEEVTAVWMEHYEELFAEVKRITDKKYKIAMIKAGLEET